MNYINIIIITINLITLITLITFFIKSCKSLQNKFYKKIFLYIPQSKSNDLIKMVKSG